MLIYFILDNKLFYIFFELLFFSFIYLIFNQEIDSQINLIMNFIIFNIIINLMKLKIEKNTSFNFIKNQISKYSSQKY